MRNQELQAIFLVQTKHLCREQLKAQSEEEDLLTDMDDTAPMIGMEQEKQMTT